mmetsp:Transcript_138729/g.276660  ORF Transcript_138729/g.276660 Transcript_138729/m.276660 type:complete len:108 (+) Transcript_138729:90-413(+)
MKTKAMKTVMKAKTKSKIAKGKNMRAAVFLGSKVKTASGHKKSDLMKSKSGKIVTKKAHSAGKKAYANIKKWTESCKKVRKEMRLKGFVPCKKGTAFYKAVKALYSA